MLAGLLFGSVVSKMIEDARAGGFADVPPRGENRPHCNRGEWMLNRVTGAESGSGPERRMKRLLSYQDGYYEVHSARSDVQKALCQPVDALRSILGRDFCIHEDWGLPIAEYRAETGRRAFPQNAVSRAVAPFLANCVRYTCQFFFFWAHGPAGTI